MIQISTKKSVGIYTLGCRVSQYESEVIGEKLEKMGYIIRSAMDICDAYIINTCTVTAESSRKSRQIIRRMINHNKNAFIVVIGCYSQIEPLSVLKIDGVDVVMGTKDKLKVPELVDAFFKNQQNKDVAKSYVGTLDGEKFEDMILENPERSRAFIKIEDGCNGKCSYCIIPKARGKARSKPFNDIVAEANALAESGHKEVVLTGIETSAYEYGLSDLINRISEIDGIKRIRLGSLDPSFTNKEFIDSVCNNKKLMPHFHLSVQSGSSAVLAKMKRKYNADIALRNINYIKEKINGVLFSADFITGFPGETEENFKETLEFVKQVGFIHVHVFPYSERPDTEAAEMDNQVPKQIRNWRAKELIKLGKEIHEECIKNILNRNEIYEVVIENSKSGVSCGHLPCFAEIFFKCDNPIKGNIVKIKPERIADGNLIGKIT